MKKNNKTPVIILNQDNYCQTPDYYKSFLVGIVINSWLLSQ